MKWNALTSPLNSDGSLNGSRCIQILGLWDDKEHVPQLGSGFLGHSPPPSCCVPEDTVARAFCGQRL
eukprot:285911-Prorocentrum_lima.AAC.1